MRSSQENGGPSDRFVVRVCQSTWGLTGSEQFADVPGVSRKQELSEAIFEERKYCLDMSNICEQILRNSSLHHNQAILPWSIGHL
jgi:hypothetical protein